MDLEKPLGKIMEYLLAGNFKFSKVKQLVIIPPKMDNGGNSRSITDSLFS